jgi:hypothetical protein
VPIGEPVSRDLKLWTAHQVIRQHDEGEDPDRATGSCGQCKPTGECSLVAWARALVAEVDSGRPW